MRHDPGLVCLERGFGPMVETRNALTQARFTLVLARNVLTLARFALILVRNALILVRFALIEARFVADETWFGMGGARGWTCK
jgi:hypothetical protein